MLKKWLTKSWESSNVKRNHLLNLINDNKEVERVTLKIDELIKTLNALLIESQDHHAIKKRMLNLEVCPIYLWRRVHCFIKPKRFYYDVYDSDYFSVWIKIILVLSSCTVAFYFFIKISYSMSSTIIKDQILMKKRFGDLWYLHLST